MDLEKQQLAVATGIGEVLEAARIKSGLSVAEVANQLHLKQSFIKALESGDYQIIGSMVYVKGYLRTYARLLRLDIETDLLHLHTDKASLTNTSSRSAPILTRRSTRWPKWRWTIKKNLLFLCVVLVAALAYYFWPTAMAPSNTTPSAVVSTLKASQPSVPLPVTPSFKTTPTPMAASTKAVSEKTAAPAMSITVSDHHSGNQNEDNSDD